MNLPVDNGLVLDQSEQSRLVIARLRFRCDRADLHEAEADLRQAVYRLAVLVEAGGQSDRIRELQIPQIGLQVRVLDLAALEVRADAEFGALDRCRFVRGSERRVLEWRSSD